MKLRTEFKKLSLPAKAAIIIPLLGVLVAASIPFVQWMLAPTLAKQMPTIKTAALSGDGSVNFGQSQIQNSNVTVHQHTALKPVSADGKAIEFQQIEIDEEHCQWTPIQRPYTRTGRDTRLDGSPRPPERSSFGEKLRTWPMGSQQLSRDGTCENCTEGMFETMIAMQTGTRPPQRRPDKAVNTNRLIDPVFDIVMTNTSDKPAVLFAIGIVPVASWTAIKVQLGIRKLIDFDRIVIEMDGFKEGEAQMHRFPEPISIDPGAPYRIKLQLNNYNRAVTNNRALSHNESAIRIRAEANQQKFESDNLYLGLCRVPDDK